MKYHPHILWPLTLSLMGMGQSACNPEIGPLPPVSVDDCTASAECTDGRVCTAGHCVDDASKTLPVVAKIQFPNDKPMVQTISTDFIPGQPFPDIIEQKAASIEVTVKRQKITIPANIRFSRQGEPCHFTYEKTVQQNTIQPATISLLPGKYTVSVFPDNTASEAIPLPTIVYQDLEIRPNQTTLELNFGEIENNKRFISISGNIIYLMNDENAAFPKSMKMRITDNLTSQVTSSVELCNEQDCAEQFTLLLPPHAPEDELTYTLAAQLKLSDTLTVTETLAEVEFKPNAAESTEEKSDTLQWALDKPVVVDIPQTRIHQGLLGLDSQSAVENAVISVSGTTSDAELAYTFKGMAYAPTDENGYFSFEYPIFNNERPFKYTISSTTDYQSKYASQSYSFGEMPEDILLDAMNKTRFSSTVYGTSGEPLASAKLVMTPASGEGASMEANTDEDGKFLFLLNPVPYTLTITPPKSAGLPVRLFDIPSPVPEATEAKGFTLGKTSIIYGSIKNSAFSPASEVQIDFYSENTNGTCQFIGSSVTDDSGQYKTIVPNTDQFATH